MRRKSQKNLDSAWSILDFLLELLVYVPRLIFRAVKWIFN